MTMHDDDRPHDDGVYQSASTDGLTQRRKKLLAGAVGAAVVLGAGAYLITTLAVGDNRPAVPQDVNAIGPIATAMSVPTSPAASSASAAPSAGRSATAAATTAAPTTSATRTSDSAQVRKEIQAARAAAERDGIPLQRPLKTTGKIVAQNLISTRTEKTGEGSIRITSARADLSGQAEQVLAADTGTRVGDAHCTQNFHFSNSGGSKQISSMLLCWRTSADRSVVTLAVAKSGRPSTALSVAALQREWSKLG